MNQVEAHTVMDAIERLLSLLVCPKCQHPRSFVRGSDDISCQDCGATFMLEDGVLDLMDAKPAVVTPIIKFIYWPGISKIYEGCVRPFFCRGATPTSIKEQLQNSRKLVIQSDQDIILDVACGTGLFTRDLALAAPRGLVVGLDSSMKILRAARSLANANEINNVVFVRADVEAMPFQTEVFDGVNCCGALHLFLKPEIALANINHVLKNDHPFSCQTFINSPHFFIRLVQESLRRKGFNYFDYQELLTLLQRQGFSLEQDILSGHMLTFSAVKTRPV